MSIQREAAGLVAVEPVKAKAIDPHGQITLLSLLQRYEKCVTPNKHRRMPADRVVTPLDAIESVCPGVVTLASDCPVPASN